MKGTYVERDRKKEKRAKVKGPEAAGAKKGVPGTPVVPMGPGVPTAMPVSVLLWDRTTFVATLNMFS